MCLPIHHRLRSAPVVLRIASAALLCTALARVTVGADEGAAVVVPVRLRAVLTPQGFDATVYGEAKNRPAARRRIEAALAEELHLVEQGCTLTEAQSRKLHLAGRGDIKECFDRIDELQAKCEGRQINDAELAPALAEMRAFGANFEVGKKAASFGESSLFRKTLRSILSQQQLAQHQAFERFRHLALVESVLASFGDRAIGVPLTPQECQQLARLLIDKTNPPTAWGSYTHYVVLFQLAKLEELEGGVAPLVDEATWPRLKLQFALVRALEPELRRAGVWPVPPPRQVSEAIAE